MLRRSSKRLKASFTAEPHEAAKALPFLMELRDGFYQLHKDAFDAAYLAYLAGPSPTSDPNAPADSPDVITPPVQLVASVTPKRAHPEVVVDLPISSSDDEDDSVSRL